MNKFMLRKQHGFTIAEFCLRLFGKQLGGKCMKDEKMAYSSNQEPDFSSGKVD